MGVDAMTDPYCFDWSNDMGVHTRYHGRYAGGQLALIGFSVGGSPSKTLVLPDIDAEIGDLVRRVNLFSRKTDPLDLDLSI